MTMIEIIEALLMKNRTIVSTDFLESLYTIGNEIPLEIHKFASGKQYATWIIPPQWDVIKAELRDDDNVIASYEHHPLFLAPYSKSFTGWVTRDELIEHVSWKQEVPDHYFYEHRVAMDFKRRLNEWRISIPYSLKPKLNSSKYFVDIQVDTKPGNMLVGTSTIAGKYDYTFAFLAHLDHPGQANDGLSGVAVGTELIKRIQEALPEPNYSYQLMVVPETIGSSVFLAENEHLIEKYLGSIFIEMAGISSPVEFSHTRRGDTYLDRVLMDVIKKRGIEFGEWPFGRPWGNDEKIFDSAGVGIPSASIGRYPFKYYHTSGDNLQETCESSLDEIVAILMDVIAVVESDFIPIPSQRVPFYLTRFEMYADAVRERSQYLVNSSIMELLWSGMSVFDISNIIEIEYEQALGYVKGFVDNKLIDCEPLSPSYFRNNLDRFAATKDNMAARNNLEPIDVHNPNK